MKAADLVFACFVSLDVSELTIGQLKALLAPFQLTETNLRSTLSRLHNKGMIDVRKRGRIAFYRLSPKGSRFGGNIGLHFQEPDWSDWDGQYWGAAFSDSDNRSRYRIRKKLTAYRFRALYPGFWIRPLRQMENIPDAFSVYSDKASFDLIQCRFSQPPSKGRIHQMYALDAVSQALSEALAKVEHSIARAPRFAGEAAFREYLQVGAELVQALSLDPLLPPALVPVDWPATQLRTDFKSWVLVYRKHSASFVERALNGNEIVENKEGSS